MPAKGALIWFSKEKQVLPHGVALSPATHAYRARVGHENKIEWNCLSNLLILLALPSLTESESRGRLPLGIGY
jgi:hypothetical protein